MIQIDYLEFRRKILHMVTGISIVAGVYFDYITTFQLFLILTAGVLISFLSTRYKIPVIYWLLEKFERKHVHPGKGAITFFVGSILALKVFPQDIALASIMILALGDGISAIIGPLGHVKTILSENKLIEGTILGAWGASIFVFWYEALLAATVAMTIEATEVKMNNKILSDNILVPLAAGTTITMLQRFAPELVQFMSIFGS